MPIVTIPRLGDAKNVKLSLWAVLYWFGEDRSPSAVVLDDEDQKIVVLPTTLSQEDSVSVGFNATLEYQYETNFLPSLPKGPAGDYLPPWTRPDKVVRDQFSSTHDAQLVMEIVRWDLTRTAD